jgi:hypothetical protein
MNVSLTVELPPDAEKQLRTEYPDLPAAVREGFLVNLFRRGILTHYELGEALGLDRFETDGVLKRHQVTEQSLSHEEIDADVASLEQFLSRPRP